MVNKLPEKLSDAINEVAQQLGERLDEILFEPDAAPTNIIALNPKAAPKVDSEAAEIEGESKVLTAMRYSALSGGKRLRPFLTVCSSSLFGVSMDAALHAASAIELVHTYSLVHDDLPAMDDDDLRRGKPSCHIVFGEAAAILAGDGLLTLAFEVLAENRVHPDAAVRCEMISCLAKAAGYLGMVGGQMMDLEAENKRLSVDQIIRLQRLKTGDLFAVSCEAGAILGKAPAQMRNVLRAYANDIGLAFQITDDLLDVEGSRAETGKAVNKDKLAGKATLVSLMGIDRAREHAAFLVRQAISHLDVFDKRAEHLRALAQFVISRKF